MNDHALVWLAGLLAKSLELLLRLQLGLARATNERVSWREIVPDRETEPLAQGFHLSPNLASTSVAPMRASNAELAQPLMGTQDFAKLLLDRCLAILDDLGTPCSMARTQSLTSAVRAMAADPFKVHTVASLANSAGMSRSSFAKSFRDVFGESPVRFLKQERLRVAKHMLQTTALSVKEIVGKIGYTSPSYFARAIHAEFGKTPIQLRERRDQAKVGTPEGGETGSQRQHFKALVAPKTKPISNTIPVAPQTTPYEVFDAIPTCVKVLDSTANILFFNRHGLQVMELDDFAPIRGKPWVSLWPKGARADVQTALEQALCGNIGRMAGFCPTAKGSPRWWDVFIVAISVEQACHLVVIARDSLTKPTLNVPTGSDSSPT